jgi:hypothetical protein
MPRADHTGDRDGSALAGRSRSANAALGSLCTRIGSRCNSSIRDGPRGDTGGDFWYLPASWWHSVGFGPTRRSSARMARGGEFFDWAVVSVLVRKLDTPPPYRGWGPRCVQVPVVWLPGSGSGRSHRLLVVFHDPVDDLVVPCSTAMTHGYRTGDDLIAATGTSPTAGHDRSASVPLDDLDASNARAWRRPSVCARSCARARRRRPAEPCWSIRLFSCRRLLDAPCRRGIRRSSLHRLGPSPT